MAYAPGTNDVIDAANKAFWTPAGDVNGNGIAAFDVVARDDDGAESVGPVGVTVDVTAINDQLGATLFNQTQTIPKAIRSSPSMTSSSPMSTPVRSLPRP